jgi:hypothetical protein
MMDLMITERSQKMNIDEEDILCMTWVDLNIVQYMIIMHTIDEMKKITLKNSERRHGILESVKIDEKLPFSISIVEYNTHMSGSDGNAQQRSYYTSSHCLDSRYWWSIFIFFLDAVVLNAYKL